MTVKPSTAPARVTGYVVVAADWTNDVQLSQNYIFEVLAGTNTDKIGSAALDPAGAPTFANVTLASGNNGLTLLGPNNVQFKNVSGVLYVYTLAGTSINMDTAGKLNANAAAFSGAVNVTGVLTATSIGSTVYTSQTVGTSGLRVGGAVTGGNNAPWAVLTITVNGTLYDIPMWNH